MARVLYRRHKCLLYTQGLPAPLRCARARSTPSLCSVAQDRLCGARNFLWSILTRGPKGPLFRHRKTRTANHKEHEVTRRAGYRNKKGRLSQHSGQVLQHSGARYCNIKAFPLAGHCGPHVFCQSSHKSTSALPLKYSKRVVTFAVSA